MKNLTPELIAKAKAAQSAEELLELAKANNVEITAEEAKIYFEQLNANGVVSDDELDVISGGNEEDERKCGEDPIKDGDVVEFTIPFRCDRCKAVHGVVKERSSGTDKVLSVFCVSCRALLFPTIDMSIMRKVSMDVVKRTYTQF